MAVMIITCLPSAIVTKPCLIVAMGIKGLDCKNDEDKILDDSHECCSQ